MRGDEVVASSMVYLDPLISRSQLAMIESRLLRSELGHLRRERRHARQLLQVLIYECASLRAEARSVREEFTYRRSVRPHTPSSSVGLDTVHQEQETVDGMVKGRLDRQDSCDRGPNWPAGTVGTDTW